MFDQYLPESWFLVGQSSELKPGGMKKCDLGGKQILLVRELSGEIRAIQGKCPHLGADLSLGKFEEGKIVCPFHAWKFNTSGSLTDIPNCTLHHGEDHLSRRLRTYVVEEKFGLIFIYNGAEKKFDLPFYNELDGKVVLSSNLFTIEQVADWWGVVANGFDLNHFQFVHHRKLTRDALISSEGVWNKKITLDYEIVPNTSLGDKILSRFFGRIGSLEYSVWGGNFILAKTRFGSFTNFMIISLLPHKRGSLSRMAIIAPAGKIKIVSLLKLKVMSMLTKKFFDKEALEVKSAKLKINSLHHTDGVLKEFLLWIKKLAPQIDC